MTAQEKKGTLKKITQPVAKKKLFYWQAPVRPFKKRNREYFTTIGAIVFLLIVILFFIKEWLLIAVVFSLMFVSYVLATVEPGKTEHTLSTQGIETGGKNYRWQEMERFWFVEKWQQIILNIELKEGVPKKIFLLVEAKDQAKIKALLGRYLTQETPEPSFMDKASAWLAEKVPLETEN